MNSTRSRWSLYGPRQMAAKVNLKAVEDQIAKAKQAKIRTKCELWNVNMKGVRLAGSAILDDQSGTRLRLHFPASELPPLQQSGQRQPSGGAPAYGHQKIWRLEPSLRCRCKINTHYRPNVRLITLTETAEFDQMVFAG